MRKTALSLLLLAFALTGSFSLGQGLAFAGSPAVTYDAPFGVVDLGAWVESGYETVVVGGGAPARLNRDGDEDLEAKTTYGSSLEIRRVGGGPFTPTSMDVDALLGGGWCSTPSVTFTSSKGGEITITTLGTVPFSGGMWADITSLGIAVASPFCPGAYVDNLVATPADPPLSLADVTLENVLGTYSFPTWTESGLVVTDTGGFGGGGLYGVWRDDIDGDGDLEAKVETLGFSLEVTKEGGGTFTPASIEVLNVEDLSGGGPFSCVSPPFVRFTSDLGGDLSSFGNETVVFSGPGWAGITSLAIEAGCQGGFGSVRGWIDNLSVGDAPPAPADVIPPVITLTSSQAHWARTAGTSPT